MNSIEVIVGEYLKYYPEEKENISKLINLIKHNKEDIFNRKNYDGHITASGFIYCLSEEKLLLLEYKALNILLQPGGHVENDDQDIISAAKREIFEETGLSDMQIISICNDINVPFDINIHYIPANKKKQEDEHYHYDFRYLFIINKLEDITINYSESNDYRWIDINSLLTNKRFDSAIKKIISLIKKNSN